MTYEVEATFRGDTICFEVQAESIKEAYEKARKMASEVFDSGYPGSSVPTVTVRQKKEEKELTR